MPLYTAEALVLRTYKLGEADRIVVFLTRDRGKKRGVARGARRPRSRFGGALEPMTRIRVAYFEKEQRELVGLNYAEPVCSPLAAADPDALGFVGYFAELLDLWAQEADADERLFRLGAAVVEALAAGVGAQKLARSFECWLLRLQGVYPSLVQCQRCGTTLGQQGAWLGPEFTLLCGDCGAVGAPDLSPEALGAMSALAAVPPERVGEVPVSVTVLLELERVHRALVTAHLEREPRAGRVLRELGAS